MGPREVEDSDLDRWDVYIARFYIRKAMDLEEA
jgi:hypothetical protein